MPKKQPSDFGSKLRAHREAAGLSLEALADKAGMHKFGVAKLERGDREPSWATVQALAHALGVSCEAFTAGAASPPAAADNGQQPKRPRGRPSKAAAVAQDTPAADKASSAPSGEKKSAAKGRGKHKGKE